MLLSATARDLGGRHLDRDCATAAAVRLIDLGLFRIGGEKYAGSITTTGRPRCRKDDDTLRCDGVAFDYIAKEGKRRTITVADNGVRVVCALVSSDNTADSLFSFQDGDYMAAPPDAPGEQLHRHAGLRRLPPRVPDLERHRADGAAAGERGPGVDRASRKNARTAAVRGVADWLGDTPAVARGSYIDPRGSTCTTSDGQLAAIPRLPAQPPAAAEAEIAVAALLDSM